MPSTHQIINAASTFFLGVIEGFYGRSYSFEQRQQLISFLAAKGYHGYCYAPKSQRQLRMAWREAFSAEDFTGLKQLAEYSQSHGLAFGLGFSPWGLQQSYSDEDQRALRNKIDELNRIGADWLCILFDDMPGDGDDLADRQLRVMHDVLRYSSASRFAFCPTYYSDDPVLESLFGKRPAHYWQQLGAGLPANVDVFWTGSKVVSTAYQLDEFVAITEQIQRKPLLWDNYPVNDGRLISKFLHLAPFQRSREMQQVISGHIVNPMNQFALSMPVLATLPTLYDNMDVQQVWRESCVALGGDNLLVLLERDAARFQYRGLDTIDAAEKQQLIAEYRAQGSAPAREVADWLAGAYQFDPACLTD
jgi:hypothetical protein